VIENDIELEACAVTATPYAFYVWARVSTGALRRITMPYALGVALQTEMADKMSAVPPATILGSEMIRHGHVTAEGHALVSLLRLVTFVEGALARSQGVNEAANHYLANSSEAVAFSAGWRSGDGARGVGKQTLDPRHSRASGNDD